MKEAGMDKAPIPVDLAIRVGWPTHEQASVWLQRELEQIGFKVNIVKETDATFRQIATKGDHQLSIEAWQSWINDPFYHLTFLFNSKSKFTNLSFYSNPAVDKLIDDNMHETNRDKRAGSLARRPEARDRRRRVGAALVRELDPRGHRRPLGLEKRWDTFERYYSLKRG
jgi:peptide/nickel transport system substrate-binding protein